MTKVKFLQDYRGKLTNEIFYTLGTVVEFDEATAAELVARGRAEYVIKEKKGGTSPNEKEGGKRSEHDDTQK